MPPADIQPYDWVAWLSGQDAKVLLIWLMKAIESPNGPDHSADMIAGWRANAYKALAAEDFTWCVDGYLEVYADARLSLLRTGNMPHEETSDDGNLHS
jgi:hypothetical protein